MAVVPINYFAVIVAAIVSMVLGFLWYGPVFGKQWISLMGIPQAEIDAMRAKGQGTMWKSYLLTIVGALVTAYVLSHALIFAGAYFNTEGLSAGLTTGFWSWLGFIAPVTLGSVLWEKKPWTLWVLNNGYHLVNLLIMGVILGIWR